MRIIICTFLSFWSVFAYSQDYQTFYSTGVSHYYDPSGSDFDCVYERTLYQNEYYVAQFDSVKLSGQDSVLYTFKVIGQDTANGVVKKLPNWTGKKIIIKQNGENIFFNNWDDTIRINTNAALNQKWKIYSFPNGNYFEGEVTQKNYKSFLGLSDSVKVITINLRDNLGNIVSDKFNGKEILLSKNYGLLKAYIFCHFPYDTNSFVLKGLSNPDVGINNITAREIFDYSIGDEFHIEEILGGPYAYNPYSTKERRVILSKDISANGDTLKYTVAVWKYTERYNYSTNQTTITKSKDTIIEKRIVSEYAFINDYALKLPHSPIMYQSTNYNNRLAKKDQYLYHDAGDGTYNMLLDAMEHYYYIEGLGEYYNHDQVVNPDHRELVYYNKGSETWGTAIDFVTLMNVQKKSSYQFLLYPNPSNGHITLDFGSENPSMIKKVKIVDLAGKVYKESFVNYGLVKIDLHNLSPGIYFCE
ncbi:MAG: T9SS type A sorting domain-containing protein, partial [Cytophagaceae bacterium]|nr:T9SS type A sorting domain-containing protein [Cytophagaceae bacterium]